MLPPRRYNEKGLHKRVWRALNDLRDYTISITPTGGRNVRIQRTSRGVLIDAEPQGAGDTRADMIFVGDYDSDPANPYSQQDVFIKDGTTYVTLELDPQSGETEKHDPATSARYRAIGGGGGAQIKLVLVEEVLGDVLKVRELSQISPGYVTTGDQFMVAKPWHLRELSNVTDDHNGITVSSIAYPTQYQRILTLGAPYTGALINQTLLPYRYDITSWLVVLRTVKQNVVEPTQPAEGVIWVDMNIDGRRWETDYSLVNVCVAGVSKSMLIRASNAF